MAILMVMRHGKSDWSSVARDDHERPLAPRGKKAAGRMGRFLASTGNVPELVLTSSAERASATVDIAIEKGGWACDLEVRPEFYGGDPETVLDIVRATPAPVEKLLVVGHNPTWEALAALCVGGGRLRFPTAAVACLEFPERGWAGARPGRAELLWFVTPRLLG